MRFQELIYKGEDEGWRRRVEGGGGAGGAGMLRVLRPEFVCRVVSLACGVDEVAGALQHAASVQDAGRDFHSARRVDFSEEDRLLHPVRGRAGADIGQIERKGTDRDIPNIGLVPVIVPGLFGPCVHHAMGDLTGVV